MLRGSAGKCAGESAEEGEAFTTVSITSEIVLITSDHAWWLWNCRQLCSYTHPALSEAQGGAGCETTHFRNLGGLKKALQAQLQLQFCGVCLESRKVGHLHRLPWQSRHVPSGVVAGEEEGGGVSICHLVSGAR